MSKKPTLRDLLVSVLSLMGGAGLAVGVDGLIQPTARPAAEDSFDESYSVVPGQLVRLEAPGDAVVWRCLPPVPDMEIYGKGDGRAVLSFRRESRHAVVAAYIVDGAPGLRVWDVQVGDVVPEAPDEPAADEIDSVLAAQVAGWCNEVKADKEKARDLAATFSTVAKEIGAKKLTTTEAVVARTYELNQSIDLSGMDALLGRITAHITQLSDLGTLNTPERHAKIWMSIAKGLRDYAS